MASIQEQLTLKLKLERTFKPAVRSLFNRMLREFKNSIVAKGQPLNASRYQGAWESALYNHYSRVQKAFSGIVKPNQKQELETDDEKESALLLALLRWQDENSPSAAQAIINTTNQNMQDSLTMANQSAIEEEIEPNNRVLALLATANLRRKFAGREETIVMTETQKASESTKIIEASVIAGLNPQAVLGGVAITTVKKTWMTAGDARVRTDPFNHRSAHGQTVPISKAFNVSGELLMYPSDTSLGASIGNVINCRCIQIFEF